MNREIVLTENELPPDVVRAIEQGKKIEAIKLLRESSGLGLANAKVLVDKASRQYGPRKPLARYAREESGLGTLLRIIVAAGACFAVYHYFLAG